MVAQTMSGGIVKGITRARYSADRRRGTLLHLEEDDQTCAVRVLEQRRDDGTAVDISLDDTIQIVGDNAIWSATEKGAGKEGVYLPVLQSPEDWNAEHREK